MDSLTPEFIDELEHNFLAMLDKPEDLIINSPEKITPELKETYLSFYACLEEFYAAQAAHLAFLLKRL